ncbi:MAG: Rieske 2Fe-2S domain-containing protein [Anaerolineales bacterium]|jgi:cytochrome b6-f complex iron-sulfur subunit
MNQTENKPYQPRLSRRTFLGITFFGSLIIFFVESIVALFKFLKPIPTGAFGGEVYAGRVDEFEINSVNRVLKGRFYLVRTEDGLLALWQKCTHLGCSVPWEKDRNEFHCPCHGSVFNQVGEVKGGPAPRPLDIFPITIRSGEIWVNTGEPTQRSRFDRDQVTGA